MSSQATIEAISARLEELMPRRVGQKRWVGPRPAGETALVPHALAEVVGYPRPEDWDGRDVAFIEIDRRLAAVTLAMLATQSQAYEFNRPPPEGLTRAVEEALGLLGEGARFFSNADQSTPWIPPDPARPSPAEGGPEFIVTRVMSYCLLLSEATFDTGVVGVGEGVAFILWGEDED